MASVVISLPSKSCFIFFLKNHFHHVVAWWTNGFGLSGLVQNLAWDGKHAWALHWVGKMTD